MSNEIMRWVVSVGLMSIMATVAPGKEKERAEVQLSARARELHANLILVDGHNDLPWAFYERGTPSFDRLDISQRQPELHTDIPRLRQGGVGVQFWSVFVPASTRLNGESLRATLDQIALVRAMVDAYPETFQLCLDSQQISQSIDAGKIASLIGVEGGHSIENSLGVLRRLYDLGARYMTLTHSATLEWADSATDAPRHGGLSPFGRQVVREMNRLGMLVDLSHVSDDCMRDALEITKAPVIFSHSSARAICDHPRNVPDDVFPLVKANRGVVMVNFYSDFVAPAAARRRDQRVRERQRLESTIADAEEVAKAMVGWDNRHPIPRGSIYDVVDHIDHLVKGVGVDGVGIGSDFDGIGVVPRQLEDVSTFPLITQELLNRGYDETAIRKIMGLNLLRVLKAAEDASDKRP